MDQGEPDPPAFIGFAGADWWYHNRAHSDFQILTRLAREHDVLLVNSIGMRMPMPGRTSRPLYKIWRKLKSVLRLLRRPEPSLPRFWVFSPLPIPLYQSALARRFSAWFVRVQVRLAARWIGIRNPVVFLTPPTAWPVVERMPARAVVYNRSDRHSVFREADQAYLRELEDALLRGADLVLYANETLLAEEADRTDGRARHLDHGVDAELFHRDASAEPDDLARIARPRIGFFGTLRSHMVDLDLLARVARDVPEARLVLIGDSQDSTDELEAIENVHLLGFRPYPRIPSYGAHFDVALLPYRKNEWIRSCNPIKLKEYLALGLPVVATDFPEAHRYAEHVRIARDEDAFVEEVRRWLAAPPSEDQRARFRSAVAGDTWDRRTEDLLGFLADATGGEGNGRAPSR